MLNAISLLLISVCADPHLWLENAQSADTQKWLVEQKIKFEKYLRSNPYVEEFKTQLQSLDDSDFPKSFVRSGENYFLHQNNALYIQSGLEGEPRLLLETDSTRALVSYVPSPSGQLVAYGLSENGSDWTSWNILEIASKQSHPESTGKTKFSTVCWSSDNLGFYYSSFDDQAIHGVYYHRLGDPQDALIYRDLDHKSHFYIPRLSSDRRYLMIDIITGSMAPNSFLCLDLENRDVPLVPLIPFDEGTYWFVCNRGSRFYFTTTKDASRRKLIALDIENPSVKEDIISETASVIADVLPFGNHFLVAYEEVACSKLVLFDRSGKELRTVPLPDVGVVKFCHGYPDAHGTRGSSEEPILFSFSNFAWPHTLYRLNLDGSEPTVFRKSSVENHADDYSIQQVFYPSKDGTRIPLFLAHKKDLAMNGTTPVLLHGYGGFNRVNFPLYNPMKMAWLQRGGIIASPCIRGGGEYGTQWHLAAVKDKKQKSIDDLLAAAEWLIASHYTNPKKLALYGFSNSAMLAGVCANQRPELFGAIVAGNGVYDMIRYPLFSLGRFWVLEYGNPDDPIELDFIKKYSPYHNVKPGVHYPPMLITVSDEDTRIASLHSYKFAAALQDAQAGDAEILLRIKHKAGHFTESIDDTADALAFITEQLGNF